MSEVKCCPVSISLVAWNVSTVRVEPEWRNSFGIDVHVLIVFATPSLIINNLVMFII